MGSTIKAWGGYLLLRCDFLFCLWQIFLWCLTGCWTAGLVGPVLGALFCYNVLGLRIPVQSHRLFSELPAGWQSSFCWHCAVVLKSYEWKKCKANFKKHCLLLLFNSRKQQVLLIVFLCLINEGWTLLWDHCCAPFNPNLARRVWPEWGQGVQIKIAVVQGNKKLSKICYIKKSA